MIGYTHSMPRVSMMTTITSDKPYCDCLTPHKGKAGWKQAPGVEWDCNGCGKPNRLFVCGLCNRPSKMVWESEGRLPDGVSILELLRSDLDRTVDELMEQDDASKGKSMRGQKLAGKAEGLAIAIAYFESPRRPDVKSIKKQAMNRYYGRQRAQR